jgi:Domain of unknown function (DUF4062)
LPIGDVSVLPENAQPTVVDRSLPETLSDPDVRSWAANQTVFVSSVMAGMQPERAAAAAAVDRLGGRAILFERLGGRDDDAETAYLDGVHASDIYLGILGRRYGRPDSTGYSATHTEYNEAVHHDLRISIWATTDELDGPQRDFLDRVRVFNTTGSYSSPDELGAMVERRLRELAAEDGSPWCKVGPAVFRVRRFTDAGERIVVQAALRDSEVVAALEALRPGQWGRSATTRVSCAGRTMMTRVDAITIEASAGRTRVVTIEGTRVEEEPRSNLFDVTFEDRTPEDLSELAVRAALFGEPNPLGSMSFLAEMDNPFEVLNTLRLSEDSVPAVAEILLVEELVGSGRAERLTALRVGPRRRGTRRVLLEWLPRRRYTNVTPKTRIVEGEVGA